MSSGYIASKDEPDPDEIIEALREAVFENPRLRDMPAEEVARQLVLDGHLQQEPSPELVAEMREALGAEEQGFEADEVPLRHDLLRKLSFRDVVFSVTQGFRHWSFSETEQ